MSVLSATDLSALNGMFKTVYADREKDLVPDGVKLMNLIPFAANEKIGGQYSQAVILGLEHGVTFASSEDDAFNLNPPISSQTKEASVRGNPMVLKSLLGAQAAARSAGGNKVAFVDATKYIVSSMYRSLAKKLEIMLLYGQAGYGKISAINAGGTLATVKTSEWAPLIWSGAENMPIEIRDATGAIIRGNTTVSLVDLDNKQLTFSGAIPGIVTTSNSEDVIWHGGAYGKEFIGIHKILSQTSGTLFGINVTSFSLFRGNSYSAGSAALSFPKLNQAIVRALEKGLTGKVCVLVSFKAWGNLLSDQAALRRYDGSYGSAKMVTGANKLEFHSQNGLMEIEPSGYVKEGYSYILAVEEWKRIGSTDITFKRPGYTDNFFQDSPDVHGFILKAMSDQALFTTAAGRNVLITDIVNSN